MDNYHNYKGKLADVELAKAAGQPSPVEATNDENKEEE